jgi:endonuclease-3
MRKKALLIIETLDKYFKNPPFPLYFENPFTLLISVMLSANTTDKQANIAAHKLYKLANIAEKMQNIPIKDIEQAIFCCGLYKTKAKNILNTAKIIANKYGGKIPSSLKELLTLPGVGRKTANIVLSALFHQDTFPVDTHIFRLAKRWGITHANNVKQTEKDLKKFFPKKYWRKLHLQMIYFGRTYCRAKNHTQENCPICKQITSKHVV